MRITSVVVFLFFLFGICNSYAVQTKPDSLFYKNTKYQKLNRFVSYHVITEGKHTGSPRLMYTLKMIAIYNYGNHRYEVIKKDKEVDGKLSDIRQFILSNKFGNREGFEGLFKINSEILYVLKPYMLKRITVFPKNNEVNVSGVLIKKLKKESFINRMSLDSFKLNAFDTLNHNKKRRVFIKLEVKSKYWHIDSLKAMSSRLKKWPDISDAVYVDLFTGINKTDNFWEIKSKIGIKKKVDMLKKPRDPWKLFLEHLRKN
jgi:hypothetical protein